ncbi:MAG: hypothetical protein QOD75_905 [Blastocatellia bacterium]|jgi:hypothetical protein|nr:hypothetical protein [Blastocatellia bacterium]
MFMLSGIPARKIVKLSAIVIAFAGLMSEGRSKPFTIDQQASLPSSQEQQAHSTKLNCLPPGTTLDEVVSYGGNARRNVTVGKKLNQLKARCRNRKLVDAKGREIRFHRPSCWGNPPADYQEIQQRESEELQRLQKRYTVIVFGCNPMIQ